MNAVRPRVLQLGVFLIVVALPIAFTTATTSPFADLKVVILALGALFVWAGGLPIDRRLARVAGLWVVVTAIAAFTGVDTLRSLTASTTGGGGRRLLTGCCAYLLVAGASMPAALLERARGWFGWTGAAVGLALLAYRVFPGTFSEVSSVSLVGASFGNQLFASAFVAAAIALLAVMALGLSAAGEMFVASALEQYGHTDGETWAYRAAIRVQPWRISAQEGLALQLALDGRSGDATAAAEASRTIDDAERQHPWDPDVRLFAADVETLLRAATAARTWLEAQLQQFPGDVAAVRRHANAPPGLSTPG